MTTQVETGLALKEWAGVIDAMLRGEQIVALRKGGIREKAFLVQGRSFYLLPTFEHQAPELVKPSFRPGLECALQEQRDGQGLIVRARADVTDCWEVDDEARLNALAPYHVFTDDFVRTRFNWRPKQPLTVMLMRVFRLERPWLTGLPSGVGGCRSWLEIESEAAPADAGPAVAEHEFDERAAALRGLLSDCPRAELSSR